MPSARPVQRVAVDDAIALAGTEGRVNVYGPAERILDGERYCSAPDTGQQVTYHARSVTMSNGGWACLACGHASEDADGSA